MSMPALPIADLSFISIPVIWPLAVVLSPVYYYTVGLILSMPALVSVEPRLLMSMPAVPKAGLTVISTPVVI